MKTVLSTSTQNRNNLLSLYKTGSQPIGQFHEDTNFGYCIAQVGDWPNKIWTSGRISKGQLEEVAQIIKTSKTPLTYMHFNLDAGEDSAVDDQRFKLKSELTAMSLSLAIEIPPANDVCFRRVTSPRDAYLWCEAFYHSFGYTIAVATVLGNYDRIPYYLCFVDGKVVGTALLFVSDAVVGIHSIGVIPSYRGKGLASQIMRFVLLKAKQSGLNHATLQASSMGIGLYKKLGFTTDFKIYNYQLKN